MEELVGQPPNGEGAQPAQAGAQPSRRRRRSSLLAILRLVLVLGLLVVIYLTLWKGKGFALVAWLLTVIVLIDNSVNVLFGMCDEPGSRRSGFIYWLATVFWANPAIQMVMKSGEVKPLRPTGPLASLFYRLGAPSIVIVENGVAVILERSGRVTQIHGPGLVFTRRFERVAHVVDLRPQVRSFPVKKIMTRDGLSFDLEGLDVFFEVAPDFDPGRGEYSFSKEAVLDLVYRGGFLYDVGKALEWGERVARVVEHHLRNVAAACTLDDIVRTQQTTARERLMREVEERARPDLQKSGVRLTGINVGQIAVPRELEDNLMLPLKQAVDMGWVQTQRDAIIGIAEGLRQAILKIEESVPASTQETMPHLLLNLTQMLERISADFLRLSAPYRQGTEGRPLLPRGGEDEAAGGRA